MEKRKKIIGVDFDETLFKHSYPDNDSEPNWAVINYIRNQQKEGAAVILVTCRTSPIDLRFAVEACRRVGIEFDAVNDNLPAIKTAMGDCRKIFCHEYIDDKNVLIEQIEGKREKRAEVVHITLNPLVLATQNRMVSDDDILLAPDDVFSGITEILSSGNTIDFITVSRHEWKTVDEELKKAIVEFLDNNKLISKVRYR